jgi:serine/threonine protein kinase
VTGKEVAIKKLTEPFQSSISAKRVYREIRLLKHVAHDNVIKALHLKKDSESVQNLNEM